MDDGGDRDRVQPSEDTPTLPAAAVAWAAVAESAAKVAAAVPAVWELSDTHLVTVLRAQQVAAGQQDAARLAVIRELDLRGYARTAAGAASTEAWLSHELLIDGHRAAADVRAARQLDPEGDTPPAPGTMAPGLPPGTVALPATGRALLGGVVSRAHADAVAALVRALPPPAPGQAGGFEPSARDDLWARAETWLLEQCASFTPPRSAALLCGHHHDVIHHTAWTVTITNARPAFTAPPLGTSRRPPPRAPT